MRASWARSPGRGFIRGRTAGRKSNRSALFQPASQSGSSVRTSPRRRQRWPIASSGTPIWSTPARFSGPDSPRFMGGRCITRNQRRVRFVIPRTALYRPRNLLLQNRSSSLASLGMTNRARQLAFSLRFARDDNRVRPLASSLRFARDDKGIVGDVSSEDKAILSEEPASAVPHSLAYDSALDRRG